MKELHDIINQFRLSGKRFSVRELVKEFEENQIKFQRDEIVEAMQHYFPFHFHFTPREVSYLLSELAKLYNPKSIADVSCGIGSNLAACDFSDNKVGYEINQEIVDFAKYMNTDIEFHALDSTTLIPEQTFDAVISTLPFGGRVKSSDKRERLEISLIRKALEITNSEGVIIVIVPHYLLTSVEGEQLRKKIIKDYSLDAVIDIPVKKSWLTVDSSILIIRKGDKRNEVYFGLYEGEPDKVITEYSNHSGEFWVNQNQLIDRLDRHYFHPKHDELKDYLNTANTKSIEELAEVIPSPIRGKEMMSDNGEILIVRASEYNKQGIITTDKSRFFKGEITGKISKALLIPGDIIIGLRFNKYTLYTYRDIDPPAIVGSGVAIIRSRSGEYIKTYLSTEKGKNIVQQQANMKTTGSVIPNLPLSRLKVMQIPVIPISELNSLSDTAIEGAVEPELWELKSKLRSVFEKGLDKESDMMLFFENRFNKIEEHLQGISKQITDVHTAIKEMESSLKEIKNLPREDEDKLRRIYKSIDEKLASLSDGEKDITFYQDEVKHWFDYWELLDEASKKFLPSAEYLFDSISRVGSEDYSPFIIQYCRALENELLKKMFESYHTDIKERFDFVKIKELTNTDITNSGSKANVFAKFVLKDNAKYTLGQMKWVIALTKTGGSTLDTSPLVMDFRMYILRYYQDEILEKEYINLIGKISDEYRNKSAHPYIMTLDTAKECQVLIRECLKKFFENKRN
jgi:hypothetical protein